MAGTRSGTTPLYSHGADHYRSPARRDPVKLTVEEVVSHRIYDYAVRSLGKAPGDTLRVIDLGCGTGDGLSLLTESHLTAHPVVADLHLDYVGVDLDPNMIDAAREIHFTKTDCQFRVGDMRDCLPEEPVDLVMSCGVPYSHLTHDEIEEVVTNIFGHIRRHRTRTAVVIDVLGRYSIEWPAMWEQTRWPYAMTFFKNSAPPIRDEMTHFGHQELSMLITSAASAAGVRIDDAVFTDRSVAVGRHTSTGEFNSTIPPYRDLVNSLLRGDNTVDIQDLKLPDMHSDSAPHAVNVFFDHYTRRWNDRVAAHATAHSTQNTRALGLALAALETEQRPGLGIGHSLSATVTIDAY